MTFTYPVEFHTRQMSIDLKNNFQNILINLFFYSFSLQKSVKINLKQFLYAHSKSEHILCLILIPPDFQKLKKDLSF